MFGFIMETLIALADAHIEFVVAGGVAVILHGVERTTMDLAYDVLARNAQAVLIAGHTVRVVSRERLIAMKRAVQPPRPKDLHDVAELERLGEP